MNENNSDHTNSPAWLELVEAISEISEEAYAASWMKDVEYDLWERVEHGPGQYGRLRVTYDHIRKLEELARKCGGWVRFDPEAGEVFVSLADWKRMYLARRHPA